MKKTKVLSKVLSIVMVGAMLMGMAACGREITDGVKVDENKFQINAFAVENGVGHQWLVQAAIKWNEMNPDSKFQVIPQTGSMTLHNGLDAMVEAKTTDINMYFGSQRPSLSQISKGLFIDVSDVYQMSVDPDGKKIAEKTPETRNVPGVFILIHKPPPEARLPGEVCRAVNALSSFEF